jgi:glycine/D-amino acid oxidase-like deaminating enzyme
MKIAIIGCGVVGATIAYELSKSSHNKITLIDRAFPASDSTGAALGVLMGIISQKTKGRAWRLRENSLKRYETLIPELEKLTDTTIPCNRQGILKLIFSETDLEKSVQLVEKRATSGWKLEIWDRGSLQAQCPQIRGKDIIAALYSPDDRQINPTILTRALVSGARINGVDCRFGVTIDEIGIEGDTNRDLKHCNRIEIDRETIEVDQLIIAAGLGSTELTQDLAQKIELRPILGQALQLRSQEMIGNPYFQPVITGEDIHLVPLGNNEYWLGATVEFPENGDEVTIQAKLLEKLYQRAISFCPILDRTEIIKTWSGKRPRPEGVAAPIIAKLAGYDNIFLATGHYRNGVLLAPATALEIESLLK